jgi:hypothetical protein
MAMRKYIERTVGYDRLDQVVLAAVVGSCVEQWDQRAVGGAVEDASGGAVGTETHIAVVTKTHVPAERVAVGKMPLPSLPLLLTAKQKNKKKRRGGAERAHALYGAGCMLFEVADFTGADTVINSLH